MICSKQATSHKPQAFKLGFTLSELLVSLGVLGLIAGLTIPSIVTSVENSKRKAILKEGVQLFSDLVADYAMNAPSQDFRTWVFTKVNTVKNCTGGVKAGGCHTCLTGEWSNASWGWLTSQGGVLPNGLVFSFQTLYGDETSMQINLDYNGSSGPNAAYSGNWDTLSLAAVPSGVDHPFIHRTTNVKLGQIRGWDYDNPSNPNEVHYQAVMR
jgi:prepilin-type N-terminal cleavage/methylation domain-containing protein